MSYVALPLPRRRKNIQKIIATPESPRIPITRLTIIIDFGNGVGVEEDEDDVGEGDIEDGFGEDVEDTHSISGSPDSFRLFSELDLPVEGNVVEGFFKCGGIAKDDSDDVFDEFMEGVGSPL